MNKDRDLSITEDHLNTYVKQTISALEAILKSAKIGYENYEKTGENIVNVANSLAKDIMWLVPNRCPDLLTYSQEVRDEQYRRLRPSKK